jgi:hypothetical protein
MENKFCHLSELCAVVSELEFNLKIAVNSDTQTSSLNSPTMATGAISTCITDIRMDLESMADARETMGRELEEMRQLID